MMRAMDRYGHLVRRLRDAVVRGPGVADPALQEEVVRLGRGEEAPVPAPVRGYTDKVVRASDQVTAADVAALRAAGFTEDQVFEVTVAAAVGAGLHRLERGLALVEDPVA
jgi:hypothetical protein